MDQIVIIGNGISGITAARHIRKNSSHRITVISGETDYFFSRTALMYVYMGHMKFEHTKPYEDSFWKTNDIKLINDWVTQIDFEKKCLTFRNGDPLSYDKLILATGSKSNKLGWSGQDLEGVQGLYHLQDLELMEANTSSIKHAVIVGGGLIGIEMAEMLHSRQIPVSFLVRENHFWDMVLADEESSIIEDHLQEYHIDLRLNTELDEILDNGSGKVSGIRTKSGEEINCDFVGLTVGVTPNIDFLKQSPLETDKGILVNEFLETNLQDVYAIGDCAQLRAPSAGRKPIEPVWYAGKIMGETVANSICDNQTQYQPGIWFNSAKFFDIEYQTYGNVPPVVTADEYSFYWESEDRRKCIRIIFSKDELSVLGINAFGIRIRHQVWNEWIEKKTTIREVMSSLKTCFFDPEFYRQFDPEIQRAFNQQYPDYIIPVRKRGLWEKILTR